MIISGLKFTLNFGLELLSTRYWTFVFTESTITLIRDYKDMIELSTIPLMQDILNIISQLYGVCISSLVLGCLYIYIQHFLKIVMN